MNTETWLAMMPGIPQYTMFTWYPTMHHVYLVHVSNNAPHLPGIPQFTMFTWYTTESSTVSLPRCFCRNNSEYRYPARPFIISSGMLLSDWTICLWREITLEKGMQFWKLHGSFVLIIYLSYTVTHDVCVHCNFDLGEKKQKLTYMEPLTTIVRNMFHNLW